MTAESRGVGQDDAVAAMDGAMGANGRGTVNGKPHPRWQQGPLLPGRRADAERSNGDRPMPPGSSDEVSDDTLPDTVPLAAPVEKIHDSTENALCMLGQLLTA